MAKETKEINIRIENAQDNYCLVLYLKSNGEIDGYFECRVCGIQHFVSEAMDEGELSTSTTVLGELDTQWMCPVCGFDEEKADALKVEIPII